MTRDQAAKLIHENMQVIYSYSLARTRHRQDAEDLAGNIILAVLDGIGRLRADGAFWGFFWAAAENVYHNYLRKCVKEKALLTDWAEEIAGAGQNQYAEDSDQTEMLLKLRRELAMLTRCHRECTVLYYCDGLKCSQIASKLGLSLEMVKYYLFKTRKLLKEGIGMERVFGEKSYKPGKFEFVTIFAGKFNQEYSRLFQRKLPGQILLSAYDSPVTVGELCMELGISAVYMEDELALLKEYHLINELPGGKYQTNLVIFTEDYFSALWKELDTYAPQSVKGIGDGIKNKLAELKRIGFAGCELAPERLLWDLYVLILFEANKKRPSCTYQTKLYQEERGVNYGITCDSVSGENGTDGFAGFYGLGGTLAASYVRFGVIKERSGRQEKEDDSWLDAGNVRAAVKGTPQDEIPSFTKEQKEQVKALLAEEIEAQCSLFLRCMDSMKSVLSELAPQSVRDMLPEVVEKVCIFQLIGYMGGAAVRGGAFPVPECPENLGIYVNLEEKRGLFG